METTLKCNINITYLNGNYIIMKIIKEIALHYKLSVIIIESHYNINYNVT